MLRPKLLSLVLPAAAAFVSARAAPATVRVGFFPNVTHAQGVIGYELTREGKGWFERWLGPGVKVEWYAFNAGPSAMEALFAGSIDLTYVGPSPTLNAYIRSQGEDIRVLAGAADGGAALVVRGAVRIERPADFRGRRIATPELGNTQDVAARVWLRGQGFRVTLAGGDVQVVPVANADQLSLFEEGQIDAAWTVEPWVSRLVREAGGRIFLEQKDAVTTVLVSSVRFLKDRPDLAARFRDANAALTGWIGGHPGEAQALVRSGLGAAMHTAIPAALVADAWPRIRFTDRVDRAEFERLLGDAQSVGFLRRAAPLDRLFADLR